MSGVRASSIRIEFDLVDDGVVMPALHHLGCAHLHVVAQVVEAQLVVGAVGDVAGVLLAPLVVVELMHDDADGEPEELVDPAHPFGVALGQVVVDGDDVDPLAGERVEVDGKRGDQRLALAGLHLGDPALVQHHAADQLHVEMPLAQRALGRLAHGGEGRHQQILEVGAVGQLLAEVCGAGSQLGVRQALELGLQCIDRLDGGPIDLELAVVRGSEDLGRNRADRQHAMGSSHHPGAVHWEPGGSKFDGACRGRRPPVGRTRGCSQASISVQETGEPARASALRLAGPAGPILR